MVLLVAAVFVALSATPAPARLDVYDGALADGFLDFGWSPRTLNKGPATLDLSKYGGWIIQRALEPTWSAVEFRYRGALAATEFLELRLDGQGAFPRVRVRADHAAGKDGDFTIWRVPFAELDPSGRPFDKLVFQAQHEGTLAPIALDKIALVGGDARRASGAVARAKTDFSVALSVECRTRPTPISELIYGSAADLGERFVFDDTAGISARRWGGNPASRYNWKLGNAFNAGSDWFFKNVDFIGQPGPAWERFLEAGLKGGFKTALVVPMLGWVAKDLTSGGFPKSVAEHQQGFDGEWGNGVGRDGKPLPSGPATLTSVPAPPEFIAEWVRAIRASPKLKGGAAPVHQYILDNEPMIWSSTHRDVHPEHVGYDELLSKTIAYARVIRREDPNAEIAGPAEWGWTNYFYSAVDTHSSTFLSRNPDQAAHDGLPLVAWYLRELAKHEQKTKERLLDVLDLHLYPQGEGLGLGDAGRVDPATAARRIRSTRALWDPTYKDESWIKDHVRLIPRMREWINAYYPSRKTSIGEYNFGAPGHMSGGLAQAEALGRFGQLGLGSAFLWVKPPKGSAQHAAFRAFRNYDGRGARFLELSVPTLVKDTRPPGPAEEQQQVMVSLFASKGNGDRWVLIALNLDPEASRTASLAFNGCKAPAVKRAFRYDGGELAPVEVSLPQWKLPPYSINVLELGAQ